MITGKVAVTLTVLDLIQVTLAQEEMNIVHLFVLRFVGMG